MHSNLMIKKKKPDYFMRSIKEFEKKFWYPLLIKILLTNKNRKKNP
jgi:hypothetical protein